MKAVTKTSRTGSKTIQTGKGLGRVFTMRNVSLAALVVYFSVFMIYPIFKAFAGSMHEWNPLIGTYKWVVYGTGVKMKSQGPISLSFVYKNPSKNQCIVNDW